MAYQGQIYRRVDGGEIWEIIEARPEPGHFGDWLLAKLGGDRVVPVSEQDLANQDLWVAVRGG